MLCVTLRGRVVWYVIFRNRNIPDLWSVLYGDNTVSQIISGKKFRRAVEAHIRTLVALQDCYFQYFFEEHESLNISVYNEVQELRARFNETGAQECLTKLLLAMQKCDLLNKMKKFVEQQEELKPTFRMLRKYMRMVDCLLLFLRSVRTANWDLHLSSLENFVKYFFALDLTNYSGMTAWYLADMRSLKESDPDIWHEFEKGNWVENKSNIPFCALACDEALEHKNRAMKVVGGLVGITQQPSALARFFLTAPELQRVSQETLSMCGSSFKPEARKHHLNNETAAKAQDKAISILYGELERIGNPFQFEGPEFMNITTKAVFSEQITSDVSRIESLGTDLYEAFKSDRLLDGSVSLWAPIKKNKLKLCSTTNKQIKVKIAGSITELNADRSLFARLLIVARSQREIDLRTTLGKYEMSVVPRSMFAQDGTMHQCPAKSKLIHILKSVVEPAAKNSLPSVQAHQANSWVAIVDGMGELQALDKTIAVKTCEDLADVFTQKIQRKYWQYDELHVVFDTYLDKSIKNLPRGKRLHGGVATQYKICDTTDISKINMKKLLSHTRTKDELTTYLAHKMLSHAKKAAKKCVVSWRTEVSATHCSLDCLKSSQEEADTKILLHALNAKDRGADTLLVFAQDTDILVLLVRRYPRLPEHTFFVPTSGEAISVQSIFVSLGALKASRISHIPGKACPDFTHYQVVTPPEVCLGRESYHIGNHLFQRVKKNLLPCRSLVPVTQYLMILCISWKHLFAGFIRHTPQQHHLQNYGGQCSRPSKPLEISYLSLGAPLYLHLRELTFKHLCGQKTMNKIRPSLIQLDTAGVWKRECLPLSCVKNHVPRSPF